MAIYDKYNKKVGKPIILMASDVDADVEWLSTGIPTLDHAIGGGLPRGRMVSISGLQSHGKTSLSMFLIAQAQKQGLSCVFVDAEHSFNAKYSETLGVNLEELFIITPDCAEEALDAIDELMGAGKADLIVVDSVASLSAKAEAEADYNQVTMALQARFMARALRKLTAPVYKNKSIIIWINQLRQNLLGGQYNPYIETGGMALKFYTSVALELKKTAFIKDGDDIVGASINIKVKKNKVGPPNGIAPVDLVFGHGFKGEISLVDMGVKKGIITRRGPSYFHGETNLGIGKDKAQETIQKDDALIHLITSQENDIIK